MNKDWQTHQVTNQYTELSNYNLFTTDTVLREYFESKQADWASEELSLS
jgi:putative acyl-CoA dehydrogenase